MSGGPVSFDPPPELHQNLEAMILGILQARRVADISDAQRRAIGERLWIACSAWIAVAPTVPVTIEPPAWLVDDARKAEFKTAVMAAAGEVFGAYCAAWVRERVVRELDLIKSVQR